MPAFSYAASAASAASAVSTIAAIPTLQHREPGFSLMQSSASSNGGVHIEKRAIVLIVFLGVVLPIIVTGVVVWGLCFYGRDRSCCSCCGKSNRKAKNLDKGKGKGKGKDAVVERVFEGQVLMKPLPAKPQPGFVRIGSRHDSRASKQWSEEGSKSSEEAVKQTPRTVV